MRKAGKKTMVGGILALSMILTGTGYAYWSDSINVTTKATTGDLDVTFADLGLYAQYDNEMKGGGWSIVDGIGTTGYAEADYFLRNRKYGEIASQAGLDNYKERAEGYHNVSFNAELEDAEELKKGVGDYAAGKVEGSDRIKIEILKMYPGFAQAFRSDILNEGDIAAKLAGMEFSVTAQKDEELSDTTKDMLGVALLITEEEYSPDRKNEEVFKLCTSLAEEGEYFEVGGVDFLRLSALEKLTNEDMEKLFDEKEILCSPATDDRMDLFLAVAMDPDAEGTYTSGTSTLFSAADDKAALEEKDDDSQNKGAEISIDFNWGQFNEGKTVADPNHLADQNVQNAE